MIATSPSPFARLRALLDGVAAPADLAPVPLHLGESRLRTPPIELAALTDVTGWTRYPPLGGTAQLRAAYAGWLRRRFGIEPDPEPATEPTAARERRTTGRLAVEPSPGSKQAVAVALNLAVAARRTVGISRVVLPNPGYPTYLAATLAAGAEPAAYRVATSADDTEGCDTGGRDDDGSAVVAAIAEAVRQAAGPVAEIVVCNPGNPRGEVIAPENLRKIASIAVDTGAVLVVDECYTDLWLGRPAPGYLSLVAEQAVPDGPFLVLHSLAKRSGAPGLRSGFVAGDPASVAGYAAYNRSCGVSTPTPVCAAAAALWADDRHVAELRAALAANWDSADELLGGITGYHRPAAGFFLWLPVTADEAAARQLWRHHALSVMPGRYLAVSGPDGTNPGANHLRIALVHDAQPMREALTRLREAITHHEEMTA